MIKHLKQPRRWLVNGTDDRPPAPCQRFQELYALEAGGAVQSRSGLIEEHDRRVVDQLQSD